MLEAGAISDNVRRYYSSHLQDFGAFAEELGPMLADDDNVGDWVVKFFNTSFPSGRRPDYGERGLAAFADRHPASGKAGRRRAPRAWSRLRPRTHQQARLPARQGRRRPRRSGRRPQRSRAVAMAILWLLNMVTHVAMIFLKNVATIGTEIGWDDFLNCCNDRYRDWSR